MTEDNSPTPAVDPGDEILANRAPLTPQPGLEDIPHPGGLVAGGALAVYALKRRDMVGLFAAGISAGLLYRGAKQNGLLDGNFLRRLLHTRTRRVVPFERQIIIDRPPGDVYRFWRKPENMAIYMPTIRDVRILGDGRSHWQLKLTDARYLEWTAELVEDKPERLLVWRTREPSDLSHDGWVSFEPLRDGQSTRLTIKLYILAPGGRPGARFLKWIQDLPVRHFSGDLQRLRIALESQAGQQAQQPELQPST